MVLDNTSKIKIALFDAKKNDIDYFNTANQDGKYEIKFFEENLGPKKCLSCSWL